MRGGPRRLARFVIALYPRAWRARYGEEVLALIDETGLGAPQALDLVWGAGAEWFRHLTGWQLGERTGMMLAGFRDMALFALAGSALAWVAALLAPWLRIHGLAIPPAPALMLRGALPLAAFLRWTLAKRARDGGSYDWVIVRPVEIAIWFAVAFVVDLGAATPFETGYAFLRPTAWSILASSGTSLQMLSLGTRAGIARLRRMQDLRAELRKAYRATLFDDRTRP